MGNYGGGGATTNVVKTLRGYDNIRHQIMKADSDPDRPRNKHPNMFS